MTTTAHHHPAGTGNRVGPGLRLRLPAGASGGSISVHEGVLAPGEQIPLHVHDDADQVLYVVEGEIEVTVGEAGFVAGAGDLIAKPHGVPHGFANHSERPARVLEITSGDSFERLTVAAAALDDPARFPELQAAHGVHPVTA